MANPAQANVNINTDLFSTWIGVTNNLATQIANTVVTANQTGWANTTGNAAIIGYFSANTIIAPTAIRGGNNTTANVLTIQAGFTTNTTTFVANQYILTTNTANVVDTFITTSYRSAKYIAQVNTSIGYQLTELLLLQDGGGNTFLTEYATLTTNGTLGTFSANISSGNVNLIFSPTQTVSTYTVNFQRSTLAI
jgi:hypothetical protein